MRIVDRNSGLALGVEDAAKASGAAAVQWNDTGAPDHQWSLVQVG